MSKFQTIGNGTFYLGNCFEVMADAPDNSVDLILCDLPYGTTQNKWDSVLDLEKLWSEYWRIAKPNAAIVLTAAMPFTAALVMSQIKYFKYDWTWKKESGTGHLNAKKMPMRDKEDIVIFCKGKTPYNPQMTEGKPYKAYNRNDGNEVENYGKYGSKREGSPDGLRYPKQVIEFESVKTQLGKLHSTQKPVALFEYLIKTYSNEGDLILDNCAGSGTTAIACENTKRRWLCIEKELEYADKAIERIKAHVANV